MTFDMTLAEKRNYLENFCNQHEDCYGSCIFGEGETAWCSEYTSFNAPEEVIDLAIAQIKHAKAQALMQQSCGTDEVEHPQGEDIINHPAHYCREGAMECLDEMELIFGKEAVRYFCLCNAWKYRYRSAAKNGEEDLKKSDFYIKKYKELLNGTAY